MKFLTEISGDTAAADAADKALILMEDVVGGRLGEQRAEKSLAEAAVELERALTFAEEGDDTVELAAVLPRLKDIHSECGNEKKPRDVFSRVAKMQELPGHPRLSIRNMRQFFDAA